MKKKLLCCRIFFLLFIFSTSVFADNLAINEWKTLNLSDSCEDICNFLFSPLGNYFAVSDENNKIIIFDKNLNKIWEMKCVNSSNCFRKISFSPDEKYFVFTQFKSENDIGLLKLNTMAVDTKKINFKSCSIMSYTPNNKYLVIGGDNCTLNFINTSNWTLTKTLRGDSDYIHSITFTPDSRYFAFSLGVEMSDRYSGTKVYDLYSWKLKTKLHDSKLIDGSLDGSISFSPDGKFLSAAGAGWLYIFRTSNFKLIKDVEVPKYKRDVLFSSLTFSPDGQYLALSCGDRTIRFCRTSDWKFLKNKNFIIESGAYGPFPPPVSFSPNGKYLVSQTSSDSLKIWKVRGVNSRHIYQPQSPL